jgi:protein phosphatase 1 regulatory subunit 21
LDEQAKTTSLRENLRTNEQAHRRTEQELDSVSFRNKQLDKRCSTLQEELEREMRKPVKSMKNTKLKTNNETDSVIEEELQKTIIENARLASLVSRILNL